MARGPSRATGRAKPEGRRFRWHYRAVYVALPAHHHSCADSWQDRRLAQQTKLLKERNASLLRAVNTVKTNPSASTVLISNPGGDECVPAGFWVGELNAHRSNATGTPSRLLILHHWSHRYRLSAMNWLLYTRLRAKTRRDYFR
jgi:hypothetical protein